MYVIGKPSSLTIVPDTTCADVLKHIDYYKVLSLKGCIYQFHNNEVKIIDTLTGNLQTKSISLDSRNNSFCCNDTYIFGIDHISKSLMIYDMTMTLVNTFRLIFKQNNDIIGISTSYCYDKYLFFFVRYADGIWNRSSNSFVVDISLPTHCEDTVIILDDQDEQMEVSKDIMAQFDMYNSFCKPEWSKGFFKINESAQNIVVIITMITKRNYDTYDDATFLRAVRSMAYLCYKDINLLYDYAYCRAYLNIDFYQCLSDYLDDEHICDIYKHLMKKWSEKMPYEQVYAFVVGYPEIASQAITSDLNHKRIWLSDIAKEYIMQ
jgi:hypothetical protein